MIARYRHAARSLAAGVILCALSAVPAFAAEPDWTAINSMDRAAFVEKFGGIFEKSPWVAEKAWDARPFANIDDLHAKMVVVAKYGNIDQQLFLLRAHPDLAGKEAQAGAMTASSVAEQASAGLNALSKEEMTRISDYNAEYKKKFGFPFMIAVRNHTKEGIFFLFKQRLGNDTVTELSIALQQVYNITRLRLDKLLQTS
jgi:2-oxo-4-hydroxy-4-carboxy-5-ureidoimidazoline decarboxylase